MCGVAKPQQKLRTCPPKDESGLTGSKFEQFTTEPSISHHRYSLNISKDLKPKKTPYQTRSACGPRVPHVTLKEVVSVKSACVCGDRKVIGVRNFWERSAEDLRDNDVSFNRLMLIILEVTQETFPSYAYHHMQIVVQAPLIPIHVYQGFCLQTDKLRYFSGGKSILLWWLLLNPWLSRNFRL